jgi:hypothetical protein
VSDDDNKAAGSAAGGRTVDINGTEKPAGDAGAAAPKQGKVHFDTSQLKSSYCNVCNATSTREEVVLNFGLNNSWDLGNADIEVQLHHRIILSPQAAKRLQTLLDRLIVEHEARYGKLG